jgi:hypothetical protein
MRTSEIGTRFGKVLFSRPVGRRRGFWKRAKADLPVDRELGLSAGFSLGVVVAITRLCAQMAFAPARGTFREFCEWAPSSRATLRMVDAVGDLARPRDRHPLRQAAVLASGAGSPIEWSRTHLAEAQPMSSSRSS